MLTKNLYRTIIISALIVVTIYYSQMLIMPIIFSALCAMFIHPWVKKLESIGLPLSLASLIVVVGIGAIMSGIAILMVLQGTTIISSLPTEHVEEFANHPLAKIDNNVPFDLSQYSNEFTAFLDTSKSKIMSFVPETLLSINDGIFFLLTCPVYIYFMLVCRSSIRSFYYSSFKKKNRHIANRILTQVEIVYVEYLRGLFFVIVIVGGLTGLGLYLLGIKYAFFLGALSGLLTLVPYVGVVVSALIPLIIALLTKDSIWYGAGVIGIYALIQFLEGNIITPKIMGSQVGINPLMVIMGIVIFGAIGGIIGMLLTIPILALIKTVAYYIPSWKPLRLLLLVN
ncbi:AI-2E family transporter [Crocinitomix algicola]|uniref:AI-2E family transporter n=1 Tax=Crocinitomix algicola TaxID=1740263 RepID=UPI0009F19D13|nr:AI-2E family transporter [Crocinitomix algicola]